MPAALAGLAVWTGLIQPAPCLAQATTYTISTIAGSTAGTAGFSGDGVKASQALLSEPIALALDSSGNLYIADSGNQRIRKITAPLSTGKISTVAGNGLLIWAGDNIAAVNASLNNPYGLLIDPSGNIYISDTSDDEVRVVNAKTGVISQVAGSQGNYGYFSNQNGGPAIDANLNLPAGLAMDQSGNLYIAETYYGLVGEVNTSGIINTIVGLNTAGYNSYCGDGGPAVSACLYKPSGLSFDGAGNLYIADSDNNCIRKVATNGIITTVAGQCGTAGAFSGDSGLATKAKLNRPWGVVATPAGDLFISDYYNNRIRMVSGITGVITTVAGSSGSPGYSGDGGNANSALLNHPTGMTLDSSGNLYIADADNNVVRMLTPTAPTVSNVINASGFGAFTSVAPGSWIEIYGSNLATDGRSWQNSDFPGGAGTSTAPTALDGTSVTIGGQPAFVDFISGGQVNVLVPSNVSSGQQPVVVKTPTGTASSTVNVNAVEPGLLAGSPAVPASMVGGTPYVVAQLNTTTTFILPPGSIAGVTTVRAQPGQTIVLYGIGFGPVSPTVNAGQPGVASQLSDQFQISIGGVPAQVTYDGMAAGYYGLYAFGVTVPASLSANDKTPITFSLNGANGAQTLYLAVQ